MIFDVGRDSMVRVPMAEPLRGTKAHVGELLDRCSERRRSGRGARGPALTRPLASTGDPTRVKFASINAAIEERR